MIDQVNDEELDDENEEPVLTNWVRWFFKFLQNLKEFFTKIHNFTLQMIAKHCIAELHCIALYCITHMIQDSPIILEVLNKSSKIL